MSCSKRGEVSELTILLGYREYSRSRQYWQMYTNISTSMIFFTVSTFKRFSLTGFNSFQGGNVTPGCCNVPSTLNVTNFYIACPTLWHICPYLELICFNSQDLEVGTDSAKRWLRRIRQLDRPKRRHQNLWFWFWRWMGKQI